MFYRLLSFFLLAVLKLRYRIAVTGLDAVRAKGNRGILFLPNHPALIDPVIVSAVLFGDFRPRILADEKQIEETVLKRCSFLNLLPLPSVESSGRSCVERVKLQMHKCLEALQSGDNVLLYPSGHIYRSRQENLRGNSGAHGLISRSPGLRVVMVRTRGLWGSSFSRGSGRQYPFDVILKRNLKYLLANFLFFTPRRRVEIEFAEAPADFPRQGGKEEVNCYLENFYNAGAWPNTYVPYLWFEKGSVRTLPEPGEEKCPVNTANVPAEVKKAVYARLCELACVPAVSDGQKLGSDLGLDSLSVCEIMTFLQQEFHQTAGNPESLKTVGDVLLAAVGQTRGTETLSPVPGAWNVPDDPQEVSIPEHCRTVTAAFLHHAAENPDFPLLADQRSGVLTNFQVLLAVLALKKEFARLPGDRIGVILPACSVFFPVFMALLFAGKTPVLLNWTTGPRNLVSCVGRTHLDCILSSHIVVEQLTGRGVDFSAVSGKFAYLEDLKRNVSAADKLRAYLQAKFCRKTLECARVPETAAVLFTSGSESEPKAVPLTHENVIADVKAAVLPLKLHRTDSVLEMLPPFHSFGLLLNAMLPAICNLRLVCHGNPTEGELLSRIIGAYAPSLVVGTPTFVGGILQNGDAALYKSLRYVITGAEKCPQRVLDLCRLKCPDAVFLEGYGITECSPIVALNLPGAAKTGSIGRVIPGLDFRICDEDGSVLPAGKTGMLYVSGPSIFNGYLEYDGPSPFVERDGKKWYRTGDLVQADAEGFLTFQGRLKRFVKIAGEMVSLPAIEQALQKRFGAEFPLAVEASGPDDAVEIVLFTVKMVDKNTVNQALREAGFAPVYYVKRVAVIPEIPLLGTGKTDYRKLKTLI